MPDFFDKQMLIHDNIIRLLYMIKIYICGSCLLFLLWQRRDLRLRFACPRGDLAAVAQPFCLSCLADLFGKRLGIHPMNQGEPRSLSAKFH